MDVRIRAVGACPSCLNDGLRAGGDFEIDGRDNQIACVLSDATGGGQKNGADSVSLFWTRDGLFRATETYKTLS